MVHYCIPLILITIFTINPYVSNIRINITNCKQETIIYRSQFTANKVWGSFQGLNFVHVV